MTFDFSIEIVGDVTVAVRLANISAQPRFDLAALGAALRGR